MTQTPKQPNNNRHNQEYTLPSKEIAPYMKHYGRTIEELGNCFPKDDYFFGYGYFGKIIKS